MDKTQVTWEEIDDSVDLIISNLPHLMWNGIVGIARGGLVPAVMLSHRLCIPNFRSYFVSTYDGMTKTGGLVCDDSFTLDEGGKDWLFVDDIMDTQTTANHVLERFPQATLAVLFSHKYGLVNEDHAKRIVRGRTRISDGWLVFPWERHNHG